MKNCLYSLLFTFFYPLALFCSETQALSFQRLEGLPDYLPQESAVQHLERNLAEYHQKEVQIRGFLYQKENGCWVLAPEPNLKSCCVGSKENVAQQLIIEGEIADASPSRSISLRGHFSVAPQWESDGTMTQLYKLEKSIVLPEGWPLSTIVFAGVLIFSLLLIWILMRRHTIP